MVVGQERGGCVMVVGQERWVCDGCGTGEVGV